MGSGTCNRIFRKRKQRKNMGVHIDKTVIYNDRVEIHFNL